MSEFKDLDPDFIKPYSIGFMYLRKYTCIDFFDERVKTYPITKHLHLFAIFMFIILMITHLHYVINQIAQGDDIIKLSASLSTALSLIEVNILYVHICFSKKKIEKYILKLGKEWHKDIDLKPDLASFRRKEINTIYSIQRGFFKSVVIFMIILVGLPLPYVLIKRYAMKEDVVYFTTFRFSLPFNYENNFGIFLLVFAYDFVMIFSAAIFVVSDLLVIIVSMVHLRTFFVILQDDFRNIANDAKIEDRIQEDTTKKLKQIVRRHINLLELMDEISNSFGAIFAIHLVLLTAPLCFYGIAVIVNHTAENFYLSFGASAYLTVYVFYCCCYGQLLTDSWLDVKSYLQQKKAVISRLCVVTYFRRCIQLWKYIIILMAHVLQCILKWLIALQSIRKLDRSPIAPIIWISLQSKDIATAAYDSAWYNLSRENKKSLMIVMLRSQCSRYVKSTDFVEISLDTFIKIMKFTWSFFSLIMTLYV